MYKAKWSPVKKIVELLNRDDWSWTRNTHCKYIELRIDTRDMHCVIKDRDGNVISLKDLSRQRDNFLLSDEEIKKIEEAEENS